MTWPRFVSEQIHQQCTERYEAWVKAGRPRPTLANGRPVPQGKWVQDKSEWRAADSYGVTGR